MGSLTGREQGPGKGADRPTRVCTYALMFMSAFVYRRLKWNGTRGGETGLV